MEKTAHLLLYLIVNIVLIWKEKAKNHLKTKKFEF